MPSLPHPSRPRAALVVAHPGHELRVHGWLERTRPTVFVLTDGSGGGSRSRLAETTALLDRAGAAAGPIYGRWTDRALYGLLLDGRHGEIVDLAAELAAALERERIEVVAGDAAEGFSPAHDLCRLLVDAAVDRLAAAGQAVDSLEFALDGAPDAATAATTAGVRLVLDDDALARKLAAARAYAGLEGETARALERHGAEAFRVETLRPARRGPHAPPLPDPPDYERFGEERVAAGRYREVIRFASHLAPVARRLRSFAAGASP